MKNRYTFLQRVLLLGSLVLFLGSAVAPNALNAQPYEKDSPEGVALMAIYSNTLGASWTNDNNWGSNEPLSKWYGVTMSGGHVVKLDLKLNNLDGTLPNVFDDLTYLTNLNLRDNKLSGDLPATFGDLVNLTFLSLKGNGFTGDLGTAGFANLTKLTEVWIHDNDFSGTVPDIAAFSALKYFSIGGNGFTGFAGSLAGLPLKELYVTDNYFDFSDLIPLKGIASDLFKYAPQKKFGAAQTLNKVTGEALAVDRSLTNTGTNAYKWFKDGATKAGQTTGILSLPSLVVGDAGVYYVEVTNSLLSLLTLTSTDITVNVASAPSMFPDWYITNDAVTGNLLVVIDNPNPQIPTADSAKIYTEVFNKATSVFEYQVVTEALDFSLPANVDDQYIWTAADHGPALSPHFPLLTNEKTHKIKIQLWGNGQASAFSDMQQSIHLSVNQALSGIGNANLYWTPYVGRDVDYYVIYGANNTAHFGLGTATELATLPPTESTYSAVGNTWTYFMVEAFFTAAPGPLKSDVIKSSSSNLLNTSDTMGEVKARISVYPNPVKDMGTVAFDNPTNGEYTMYLLDLSGKVLRTQENITGTEFTFNRSDLRTGIYLIQMVGDHTMNTKIVID
jgi:hypothetical protein